MPRRWDFNSFAESPLTPIATHVCYIKKYRQDRDAFLFIVDVYARSSLWIQHVGEGSGSTAPKAVSVVEVWL